MTLSWKDLQDTVGARGQRVLIVDSFVTTVSMCTHGGYWYVNHIPP